MQKSTLLLLGSFLISLCAFAQRPHRRPVAPAKRAAVHRAINKAETRSAINRTAKKIRKAKVRVAEHKNYTGHLSRSVAHQRHALRLYRRGKFRKSFHHTIYARKQARKAIAANKGKVEKETLAAEEKEFAAEMPSDEELQREVEFKEGDIKEGDKVLSEEEVKDIDIGN